MSFSPSVNSHCPTTKFVYLDYFFLLLLVLAQHKGSCDIFSLFFNRRRQSSVNCSQFNLFLTYRLSEYDRTWQKRRSATWYSFWLAEIHITSSQKPHIGWNVTRKKCSLTYVQCPWPLSNIWYENYSFQLQKCVTILVFFFTYFYFIINLTVI